MKIPSTLIVGHGITGKNLHREIAALNPDICDKSSTLTTIAKNLCKLTFINVKNLHVKNIMCNFVT